MIPSPIRKVLSSIQKHRVRALLMGGQACVFYGAAEFSRDTDFAIVSTPANLARLRLALKELQARTIAVPPFERKYLLRGHAIHFRCSHPQADQLRIDVMTRMRGVAPFAQLWKRRTTLALPDGTICNLLSIADLVQAKKTQRDKDWPMIKRLLESHYFTHKDNARRAQVAFWLREMRTPELLLEVASAHPGMARRLAGRRKLLHAALCRSLPDVAAGLEREERNERQRDKAYWKPLRHELETLRHAHAKAARNRR